MCLWFVRVSVLHRRRRAQWEAEWAANQPPVMTEADLATLVSEKYKVSDTSCVPVAVSCGALSLCSRSVVVVALILGSSAVDTVTAGVCVHQWRCRKCRGVAFVCRGPRVRIVPALSQRRAQCASLTLSLTKTFEDCAVGTSSTLVRDAATA
jgi:hypothetical protein